MIQGLRQIPWRGPSSPQKSLRKTPKGEEGVELGLAKEHAEENKKYTYLLVPAVGLLLAAYKQTVVRFPLSHPGHLQPKRVYLYTRLTPNHGSLNHSNPLVP